VQVGQEKSSNHPSGGNWKIGLVIADGQIFWKKVAQ
jgi:hypothetical protein